MTGNVDISNVTAEQRAQIIREERDQLVLAWVQGKLREMSGAENWLNARIQDLGVETMTGDTTEGHESCRNCEGVDPMTCPRIA
jgi:hypothetical protein